MGQLADEEVGAQGDWATRTSNEQLSNIQTRFSDIHAGASGVSLSGLQLQSGDDEFSFAELNNAPTGGSAGDAFGPWWCVHQWGLLYRGTRRNRQADRL